MFFIVILMTNAYSLFDKTNKRRYIQIIGFISKLMLNIKTDLNEIDMAVRLVESNTYIT